MAGLPQGAGHLTFVEVGVYYIYKFRRWRTLFLEAFTLQHNPYGTL